MLNILNGLVLILGAVLVFITSIVQVSFTALTVAAYTCFFGLMMICVELNIANVQPRIQNNFGFLFTFIGRAIFILFAATMAMAMASWITYITGGVTAANALFNMYCMCVHPAFHKGGRFHKHTDPFKSMTTGEEEVAAYLRKNPDLAVRVGATAARAAASHPDLARKAMEGAASSATAPAAGASSPSPFTAGGAGEDDNPFA